MKNSPLVMKPPIFKPEEELYNISFFEPNKTYDVFCMKKHQSNHHHELCSWSDKDDQFFNFTFQHKKDGHERTKTPDFRMKKNSHEKLRMSHSISSSANKVNLDSKISGTTHKFFNPKHRSKS